MYDDDQEAAPRPHNDLENLKSYFGAQKKQGIGRAGLPTSLPALDKALNGLRGLSLLGGGTGVGKSSLAMQVCLHALQADETLGVVYAAFDGVSLQYVFDQRLCHLAQIDYWRFASGAMSSDERSRLSRAQDQLIKLARRMHTVSQPQVDEQGAWRGFFAGSVIQLVRQERLKRVLLVVDMLQNVPLMRPPDSDEPVHWDEFRRAVADPDHWRLEQIRLFHQQTLVNGPEGWPILLVSETRKPEHGQAELKIQDLLGSVGHGYLAHSVLLLYPSGAKAGDNGPIPMTLRVAKARGGQRTDIPLSFHHGQFRFVEANTSLSQPQRKPKNPKAGN